MIPTQKAGNISAIPSKRIYQSIIADYDLTTAICELIDNALDARKVNPCSNELTVRIAINSHQEKILIEDNACGVKEEELTKLISPGETTSDGVNGIIGIFGVGSKRAVVALSQEIKVTTRYNNRKTYCLEYNDDWLQSDSWDLPYYEVEDIAENTTKIELSKLRVELEEINLESLQAELETIYAYFIKDNEIKIFLNDTLIEARFFDQWAFPPPYEPRRYTQSLRNKSNTKRITFELTSGLTYEKGSISGDYGVFIYCNKRLIARALKTPEVGFDTAPHPSLSIARIIVHLEGTPDLMPWLSNKRGISYNHDTFRLIRENLVRVTKNAIALSKALKQDAENQVEPFKTGTIKVEPLGMAEVIKPSKLPSIPKTITNYKDNILLLNKALGATRPWTKSLYESIIAEELISKQKSLSQRNKISLVILDSIVETGCEEYLIQNGFANNNVSNRLGRINLLSEVEKHVLRGNQIWKEFPNFYQKRRSISSKDYSEQLSDQDIEKFRNAVKIFLSAAFEIRFP